MKDTQLSNIRDFWNHTYQAYKDRILCFLTALGNLLSGEIDFDRFKNLIDWVNWEKEDLELLVQSLEVPVDLLYYLRLEKLDVFRNPQEELDQTLRHPIEDLELTVRSTNSLRGENIQYIGDLVQYSEKKLLKLQNLDKSSANEIKTRLTERGLSLAKNE